MARRCRVLPVLCFSNCSCSECDVDRGWPEATRNALICFWNDIFEPYLSPYMPLRFGIVERRCDYIAIRGLSVAGAFSFFISSFLAFFFLQPFLPLFPLS